MHLINRNKLVDAIDLRPLLKAAKERYPVPLYARYDTHWNGLGASVAAASIAKKLNPPLGL